MAECLSQGDELSPSDTYTILRPLQKHHFIHCQFCKVPVVRPRDQQEKSSLICPACSRVTPYPAERKVSSTDSMLSANVSWMGSTSTISTVRQESGLGHYSLERAIHYCPAHPEEELKLVCETCSGELLCLQCIMREEGRHHDHQYMLIKKAFEKSRKEIVELTKPLEEKSAVLKTALKQVEKRYEDVVDVQAVTESKIRGSFGRIKEVLQVRETELVSHLEEMTQSRLRILASQRDWISANLSQLSSCLHIVEETLKTGSEEDVLIMKANTVKQVEELGTPINPDSLKPTVRANMKFLAMDITDVCKGHGNVVEVDLPEPTLCEATGKGLKTAVVDKTAIVTLNFQDKQAKKVLVAWDGELVSEITGTSVKCHVERKTGSQYELSYKPSMKGRHQLHITVENQHIRGSPFSVAVKSPVVTLTAPFLLLDGIEGPWGVVVNQRGEAIVTTDGSEYCISVFSSSGEKLRSFGTRGSGFGQLQHHRGLTVDNEGNILVVDSANHRIQKFTEEGEFLTSVGTKGCGSQQLSFPVDIALNSANNRFYVVDNDNHRIQVLNYDFTFHDAFGKKGTKKGRFNEPCGIACDSAGKVYVTDRDNHRVQVFSANGKFVRSFGKYGHGKGELDLPYFIAIDSSSMVYVSEWGNNRISVFTLDGQFLTCFGRKGKGLGEFEWPHGLAVDDCGVVYVCDGENNRVQVF